MLSTANVVRTAMLILLSPEPPVLHACTRQPSGTWMNAPLSAVPFRNMWIVLELVGLLLPLVEADEDEDNGSKVVQFHCGDSSCQPSRYIVELLSASREYQRQASATSRFFILVCRS